MYLRIVGQEERIVTSTARGVITNTPIAQTPTPFVSPSLSVWSLLPIVVPPAGWAADALRGHFTQDTTQTIGGTAVRTLLMTITTGKLRSSNTWKCQSKRGVMSWPRSESCRTLFSFYHFYFPCIIVQNLPEHSTTPSSLLL